MTNASDRIIDLYQRRAHDWDAARGRTLFERPWLDRFVALLPAGGRVIDVGCGTGEPIARYLIDNGLVLTGVDGSEAMIAICQERFPAATFVVADMRRLALGARFSGIVAWDSFFHLTADDQRRMFPIFAALAAPQGALLFTSGPEHGEALGDFHGEVLYHASLAADEYRALLDAHGFAVVSHVADDAGCGGHTVWLARRR